MLSPYFEIQLIKLGNLIKNFREYIRFIYEYKNIRHKPVFPVEVTGNLFLLFRLALSLRGFCIFILHRSSFSRSLPSTDHLFPNYMHRVATQPLCMRLCLLVIMCFVFVRIHLVYKFSEIEALQ
jgi:hypothetical protein